MSIAPKTIISLHQYFSGFPLDEVVHPTPEIFLKTLTFKQILPLGGYCHGKMKPFLPPLKNDAKKKILIAVFHFFVSPRWLPNGQLWPLLRGQSHLPNVNRCIINFQLKGHQDQFYEFLLLNDPNCPKPKFKII